MMFGVHYHPKSGHFLVGSGGGSWFTFLHLQPGEYTHEENGIAIRSAGRLERFSTDQLPHMAELHEFRRGESGVGLTCEGSEVACRPDFFLERLDWILKNTIGRWSLGIHDTWCSPPFWFTFEKGRDAARFRTQYGKERIAEVIRLCDVHGASRILA
jgi:hypothetical protein